MIVQLGVIIYYKPVIYYECQYQEDLERAQALSLESLALQEFRLKKLQAQYANYKQESKQEPEHSSSEKQNNNTETDVGAVNDM